MIYKIEIINGFDVLNHNWDPTYSYYCGSITLSGMNYCTNFIIISLSEMDKISDLICNLELMFDVCIEVGRIRHLKTVDDDAPQLLPSRNLI